MANNNRPRFVLDLRVSFEELLALNAAVNVSIKGVKERLSNLSDDSDDRGQWERRLEIAESLSSKLDAYIDNPTFVGEQEGGK